MKKASTAGCRISTAWWSGVRASSFRQSPSMLHSSSRLSCSLNRGNCGTTSSSSFFSFDAPLLVLGPATHDRFCFMVGLFSSAFHPTIHLSISFPKYAFVHVLKFLERTKLCIMCIHADSKRQTDLYAVPNIHPSVVALYYFCFQQSYIKG